MDERIEVLRIGDLVEGGRELTVECSELKIVKLRISGGREIERNGTFLVDSEDVDELVDALIKARGIVRGGKS